MDPRAQILQIIDEHRQDIINFAQDIFVHPELGFKENYAAEKIADKFETLGLSTKKGLALTGVKASLGKGEFGVAAIGELDAIRCPTHPYADAKTGAAHACGHHAQLAAVYGAAIALSHPEIAPLLGGRAIFFAVPSEEYGEIEYKNGLIAEGKLKYGAGKSELIQLGEMDDIDVAVVHHVHFKQQEVDLHIGLNSTNGYTPKTIKVIGKAAHAAMPYLGVNALSAATVGLTALGLARETFNDQDFVRVHPIITKGGELVNVIPDEVVLESAVRAKTLEAMLEANKKTNRAFEGGAYALGATVVIKDSPGYLPTIFQPAAEPLFTAASLVGGKFEVSRVEDHGPFSTDVGDLTHLMPVFGFTTGGFSGDIHTATFQVENLEKAFILPAKMMALTVFELLRDQADLTRKTVEAFVPKLQKEAYMKLLDDFNK